MHILDWTFPEEFDTPNETVAQFRRRLNIVNTIPVYHTFGNSRMPPEDFLTEHERNVERLFTPAQFEYIEIIHGPSSFDFGYKLRNIDNDPVHFFFPTDHESREPYVISFDQNVAFSEDFYYSSHQSNGIGKFEDPLLISLETDWYEQQKQQQISLQYTRLLLLSDTSDGFFFFFG